LERSSVSAELIDRMMSAYPDLANPYTLWVAAYDLSQHRNWRSEQVSGRACGSSIKRFSLWTVAQGHVLSPTWVFDEEAV
jgi:hypothetical protein